MWFGQYAPHASSYIPVYAIADDVPSPFAVGSLHAYDGRRRGLMLPFGRHFIRPLLDGVTKMCNHQ